jgi:aarF domain-containing kinase
MHVVFEDSEANELSIPSHDDDVKSLSPSSPSSSQTNSSKLSSESNSLSKSFQQSLLSSSWTMSLAEGVGNLVGMDNIFFLVRLARRLYLRITATTVRGVEVASNLSLIPTSWSQWAKQHENATYQAAMLDWTENAIDSLFDVHGYQIFDVGLFNADCHPGNILVCSSSDEDSASSRTMDGVQIGLIDWGQCKRLDVAERARVAKLIVSVAEGATDDVIAADFRLLGVKTKNDSTKFLAEFAKLMFGKFRPEHMTHSWHKKLHQMDRVTFFPSELSMVYRTSLLLRGLAMSFQLNVSVGEKWYQHALRALRAVDKDI